MILGEDNPALHSQLHFKDILGLVPLFLGIFLLSFAAIFIRIAEQDIGAVAITFNRLLVAAIALWVWYAIQSLRQPNGDKPTTTNQFSGGLILWLLADIMVGSLAIITWVWSLEQTSVANSNLLHNTTPVFAVIGGWLLFRERFNRQFLMGMVITCLGVSLISLKDANVGMTHLTGDMVALLSAGINAIHYLIRQNLRQSLSTEAILRWYSTIASLMLCPLALFTEGILFPSTYSGWFSVISLGLLCGVIGQGVITYYLKNLSAGFTSVFLLLEPIFTTLLAWAIFHEGITLVNAISFAIVLIGLYLCQSEANSESQPNVGTD